MTTRKKLLWTTVGVVTAFWACWAAVQIERFFVGHDIVKLALFPSIQVTGWLLRRDDWTLVWAALLQFPAYGTVVFYAWKRDRLRPGLMAVTAIHLLAAMIALILAWPYLIPKANKPATGKAGITRRLAIEHCLPSLPEPGR